MSIEQHAEDSITDYFESKERGDSKRITHYIARHMQSAIDEATAPLRQRIAELDRSLRQQNHEVCQTLGKALHYAWFKDDQANFPGATEADGVCVGDHVAETLAVEASKRIAALEGLGPLIEEYIAAVNKQVYLEDQSGEMLDLSLQIGAKLRGCA